MVALAARTDREVPDSICRIRVAGTDHRCQPFVKVLVPTEDDYWSAVPSGYVLSPVVNTVPATPSRTAAVASSSLLRQDAMSPAPTKTGSGPLTVVNVEIALRTVFAPSSTVTYHSYRCPGSR